VATRKQRRRREKEKRHDYEIVYVDDEGNEVEPDTGTGTNGRAPASAKRDGAARKGAQPTRRGRVPQPPSWKRVTKRGAIFAPLFLATVLLLGGSRVTFAAAVVQTLILVVVFVPFSYFLDSMLWRSHQRRSAAPPKR
jgi:hypothetical protein